MERSGYPYRDASLEERRRHPDGSRRQKVRYTRQYDFALLFLTVGIALFGVIMIYSAGYYTAALKNNPLRYVKSQLFGLVLGIVGMIVVSLVDYQVFMQKMFRTKITMAHLLYLLAIILQGVVLFVGAELNGAKRWLKIGADSVPALRGFEDCCHCFYRLRCLSEKKGFDRFAGFCRILLYMAPLILLILKENLSSAIIVAGITFGMCFVASRKKGYFLVIVLFAAVGLAAVILLGEGFRMERIEIWMDVENHAKAFQIRQGLYAIASGGLLERGWGRACKSWALFRRHTMI